MQQVGSLKNGLLEPNPFGPNEVMLGGTPEILLPCPPNPMEVTEAGTPLICPAAETVANNPSANPTTIDRISRHISKSYLSSAVTAHLLSLITSGPTDLDD